MPKPDILIDENKCIGCKSCVLVCPDLTITINNNKAAVVGDKCMVCGHCMAVCSTEAITVRGIDPEASHFTTFQSDDRWVPPGASDISSLVKLMRSRRSIRNYSERPVDIKVINDLIKIGATAPSGTNSQKWTFSILPTRLDVLALGNMVADFFSRLNQKARNPILRNILRLLGKHELHAYYLRYFQTVADALDDWKLKKIDRLFHGAPAAILVGAKPGASCPAEDALLATQNILLAAHAMGLGTCLIGYVVEALKRDKSIKKYFQIPAEEQIYAVIALGYGTEKYHAVPGRKKILMRVIKSK